MTTTQGEDESGGFQHGLCHTPGATANASAGQKALQD